GGIEKDGRRVDNVPILPGEAFRFCDHEIRAWLAPTDDEPALHSHADDPSTDPARLDALARRSMALALRVAANPSAPIPLLRELSASPASPLPWTVAANPSFPLQDLLRVWSFF